MGIVSAYFDKTTEEVFILLETRAGPGLKVALQAPIDLRSRQMVIDVLHAPYKQEQEQEREALRLAEKQRHLAAQRIYTKRFYSRRFCFSNSKSSR